MKHRKDDLLGIRKARFASFVLLLICFAAMLVVIVLAAEKTQAYIASVAIIAALVASWWFVYRHILYREAGFFGSLAAEIRDVHHRLRMLESAVRQIGDGVVIVADDGDFVLVNETAKRLLTAFDGDLDGPRYDEYAAGFSGKLERSAILEAAQENRQAELISVGGQYYKIGYVSLIPEKDRGQSAVAVISDVTEYTNVENMQSEFIANVSHELK
ncbi:MAG: cell wall metabolism sensor histidine kinase WalK, partial [Clostridiales bacterium]|nr:cell wall metabolism sensor histidine kinase WalK [Clostridiales bacterium]